MKNLQIAAIAQIALASLSAFAGEQDGVMRYADLPEPQKIGLLVGVDLLLADPNAGPESRHNAWMGQMLAEGWRQGKKNDEARTHPRLVPFEQLSKKDQAKELLFHALVREMALIQDAPASVTAPATIQTKSIAALPVKYIGNRDEHTDNLYGTKLVWVHGQTHPVPVAIAKKMFEHTDTYGRGDGGETVIAEQAASKTPEPRPPLPQLDNMDRNDMLAYAQQNFGENFPEDMSSEDMRGTLLSLVQGRGQ